MITHQEAQGHSFPQRRLERVGPVTRGDDAGRHERRARRAPPRREAVCTTEPEPPSEAERAEAKRIEIDIRGEDDGTPSSAEKRKSETELDAKPKKRSVLGQGVDIEEYDPHTPGSYVDVVSTWCNTARSRVPVMTIRYTPSDIVWYGASSLFLERTWTARDYIE